MHAEQRCVAAAGCACGQVVTGAALTGRATAHRAAATTACCCWTAQSIRSSLWSRAWFRQCPTVMKPTPATALPHPRSWAWPSSRVVSKSTQSFTCSSCTDMVYGRQLSRTAQQPEHPLWTVCVHTRGAAQCAVLNSRLWSFVCSKQHCTLSQCKLPTWLALLW